jgi:hypothetical protein
MAINTNKWLQDYDHFTLEAKSFEEISFFQLFTPISKEKPMYSYTYFSDPLLSLLQKKFLEFLDVFQHFFEEILDLPLEFIKNIGCYLNCERFYCLESWKPIPNKEFSSLFLRHWLQKTSLSLEILTKYIVRRLRRHYFTADLAL